MKKTITINLDVEVVEELQKEKNYSALINSYLRNYFELGAKPTHEIQEEIDKEEMERAF
ncbi:MAG: hypothetical protein PHZ25_01700 [Candidatus Pacebacteria bacterium]|nr:hypothetical protein [Candidatus Paceibacterota bacterium]